MAKHLSSSYGMPQVRAHARNAATGTLDICSDLSAIHYFLSGEQSLESLTQHLGAEYKAGSNTAQQKSLMIKTTYGMTFTPAIGNKVNLMGTVLSFKFKKIMQKKLIFRQSLPFKKLPSQT